MDTPVHYIIEAYDKGYLMAGKYGANYSKYNWLIKTDINGEILWEKTIGDGIHSIALLGLDQDSSGNGFLCGLSNAIDSERDPLLIKVDSCGEKQWCKIFYTENNYDYASNLTVNPEGDVIIILNLTNPELWIDPICIAKLSTNGVMIWKQCYTTSDTNQRNEITREIICTPDQGFLVTGFCYYQDPIVPNHWIPHPYLLKVDSTGNFEWETVIFKETNLDGGAAWSTVVSPDGNYYYSSLSHYLYDDNQALPALAKLDLQGNVLGVYDAVSGFKFGLLYLAQFLDDTTLCASANWGMTEEDCRPRAVIIDTLGKLLNSTVLTQDIYTSFLQVTYDGKLVYGSNTYQNNQFDCFLTKLNQNLEDDSIYTRPFTYDSLCPYQILSDTIVQDDCELIVGIEEEEETGGQGEEGKRGEMEIWPNPAESIIHCRLSNVDCRGDCSLMIYDIFGREAPTRQNSLPPGGGRAGDGGGNGREGGGNGREGGLQNWQIDVSTLPPGIYLAVVKNGHSFISSAKFVVVR